MKSVQTQKETENVVTTGIPQLDERITAMPEDAVAAAYVILRASCLDNSLGDNIQKVLWSVIKDYEGGTGVVQDRGEAGTAAEIDWWLGFLSGLQTPSPDCGDDIIDPPGTIVETQAMPETTVLYSADEMATMCEILPETWDNWVSNGHAPEPVVIDGVQKWRAEEIEIWLKEIRSNQTE